MTISVSPGQSQKSPDGDRSAIFAGARSRYLCALNRHFSGRAIWTDERKSERTGRPPVRQRKDRDQEFVPGSEFKGAAVHAAVPWTRVRRVGAPGPSSWST
jgi:hypothetical protein